MSKTKSVTKSTLYVAIGVSLIAGFLAGVVYTIYNAPVPAPPTAQVQQSPQKPPQSSQINQIEQEVTNHPDDPTAWARLGHAYFDSNQTGQAINAYTKSLDLHPHNPDLLTDLGVMYRRNGQPDKAVASFDKAIDQEPEHQQAMFNKGVVLLNDLNDPTKALIVWEKLIQINPKATIPTGAPLNDLVEKIKQQISENKKKP